MSPSWFFKKKDETRKPESPSEAETKVPIDLHRTESGKTQQTEKKSSLFARALTKTRTGLKSVFTFRRTLDEKFIGEIEAELYAADFGPETVEQLISGPEGIRAAWKSKHIEQGAEVRQFLKDHLKSILTKRQSGLIVSDNSPTVLIVAGVNGAGKTTSIAKLAKRLRDGGSSVLLAAADTFRAAAVEQLTVWGDRLGVEVVTGKAGADPASVAFRGAEAALEKQMDYLIVDTAGRLHTQKNLMRELGKIRSVLAKKIPGSPHECLLVLDATTGQNALSQAKLFQNEVQLTGIVLAKLDGTAKGGIVVSINNVLDIPVKFVGLGETLDDMEPFDAERFVDAVFE